MTSLDEQSTQGLGIYAILNLSEPPRLLINKRGNRQFHCYFSLPLPPQIIVFCLGKCSNVGHNSRILIDIFLDDESPPYRIGYLEKDVQSTCYEPEWPDDFLKRSYILHEKDKMAQLLLTVEDYPKKCFPKGLSNVTAEKFQKLEKRQLVVKLSNELTPQFHTNSTKSPERPTKKMKKSNCTEKSLKGKKDPVSVDTNNNHFVQTTLTNCFSMSSKKCNIADLTPAPSPEPLETENKQNNIWPSSRWGHSACAVNDNKVVVIGGQGENYRMVQDSLCVLDHESSTWDIKISQRYGADRRMGHTSTFDPIKKLIYVYGGSKNKRWFKDVHILSIETWKWIDIEAVGNAPKRAYHSSILFEGELIVFGGVYPNPHPHPDGCSNDLYMFNPELSNWYQPIITGKQPAPRSGHSFKLYDENKAIIFGGWDAPCCYNDIITLDLALMEYDSPSVIGIKPTARSWHSSTLLAENKLLVHGGFDGSNNMVLGDSFIFDIGKLTWLKVNTDQKIQSRVGHTMFCFGSAYDSNEDVVMFGGGDNMGNFFSDLIDISSHVQKKTRKKNSFSIQN